MSGIDLVEHEKHVRPKISPAIAEAKTLLERARIATGTHKDCPGCVELFEDIKKFQANYP